MLIWCDWGTRVSLPTDEAKCQERAVQRFVLHGPGGSEYCLQVCERHRAVIEAETDPHAETSS